MIWLANMICSYYYHNYNKNSKDGMDIDQRMIFYYWFPRVSTTQDPANQSWKAINIKFKVAIRNKTHLEVKVKFSVMTVRIYLYRNYHKWSHRWIPSYYTDSYYCFYFIFEKLQWCNEELPALNISVVLRYPELL